MRSPQHMVRAPQAGGARSGDGDAPRHSLDDARGQMREGHTSAQWELIAREKVARTLLETGQFTADDLSEVNMPTEYRRHIHGAVTGFFAGAELFMDFVGRQKSSRPSRKGGKNDLYRINARGRYELPKLLRDPHSTLYTLVGGSGEPASGASQLAAASSQEKSVGVDADHHGDGEGAVTGIDAPAVGVVSGAQGPSPTPVGAGQIPGKYDQGRSSSPSSVAGTDQPDSSEVLQLDGERRKAPSMFDPWEDAA